MRDHFESDEMEMPTPCQKCGEWFELNEGRSSRRWYPDTVICSDCGEEEQEEIEREEEIKELEEEISTAKAEINTAEGEIRYQQELIDGIKTELEAAKERLAELKKLR